MERLGFGRDLTTPDSISDCTKLQPIILSYEGGGHGSNRAGAASAHARRDFMRTKVGPGIRLPLRLDLALKLALGPSESFFMLKTEYSAFSGARAGLSRLFGLFS